VILKAGENYMLSGKFKATIFWTVYFVIIVGVIIPWLIQIFGPTFFSSTDFSGIISSVQNTGIILSFLSVAFGGLSVWQANSGSKEIKLALASIEEIKHQQLEIKYILNPESRTSRVIADANTSANNWSIDDINK